MENDFIGKLLENLDAIVVVILLPMHLWHLNAI